jgi:hypothetical protein
LEEHSGKPFRSIHGPPAFHRPKEFFEERIEHGA